MSIKSVMPSNHLILCRPSPPAFNLSQHQGLFKWVCSSHQVAKVLEFQLQHQSFQWTPRTKSQDWLDLPAVQGILKSLLQHHSSKPSILQHSAFFKGHLSHRHTITGKTKALTVWITTDCGKFFKRWEYQTTWPTSWEICWTGWSTNWINVAGRNIYNLRYADDNTLMGESKEELVLLIKVKVGSEKFGLKLNIQKTKIMASGPITSWKYMGKQCQTLFFGLQNHCRWWLQPWN